MPFQLKALDIEGLLLRVNEFIHTCQNEIKKELDPVSVGSFGTNYPLLARPNDKCFVDLQQKRRNQWKDIFGQIVKECQADQLYRVRAGKIKTLCKHTPQNSNNKLATWHG